MLYPALMLTAIFNAFVVWLLLDGSARDFAFGPGTDARLILGSVLAALAIAGLALTAALAFGWRGAFAATLVLFAIEILYRVIAVSVIGPSNVFLASGLIVSAVQLTSLIGVGLGWWSGRGDQPSGVQ